MPRSDAPNQEAKAKAATKRPAAEPSHYEEQLRSALAYRRKFGREDRWLRYTDRLRHVYRTGTDTESPTINIMAARIRSLVPQLAIGMPSVKVESYFRPTDPNSEPALSYALEMLWRAEGMDETTRRITLDAETYGIGIGFIGYQAEIGSETIASTRKLFGVVPAAVTERLSDWTAGLSDAFSSEHAETVQRLLAERVFMERVSPFDYFIDPTAAHWTDAAYMGRRIHLTEHAAKQMFGKKAPAAASYGNVTYRENGSDATDPFDENTAPEVRDAIGRQVMRVDVWEMWDARTKRTVYLDAHGKYLLDREWASTYPGFPFDLICWDEVPDNIYPEGLSAALEPLQNELHTIRKRELQEARKAIRKWYSSGPLSTKAKQGLRSDVDGDIVEGNEYDRLEPLQHQPIPADFWLLEQRIKSDMDEVSLTSPMLASANQTIRRSATETAYIQSASDAMIGYRQLLVERFTERALEIMLSLVTSVFDQPLTVKISNADPELTDERTGESIPLGATIAYEFVGTEHAGFYRVKVEPGSMVAQAKDVERQQLMAIFGLFKDYDWFDAKAWATLIANSLPSVRDATRYILTDTEIAARAQRAASSAGGPMTPGLAAPGGAPGPTLPPSDVPGMQGPPAGPDLIETLSGAPASGAVNPTAQGDILSALFGGMSTQG